MQRLLEYAQGGNKTECQLYVAGFNCDPATAFSTMQATKRRWGKSEESGVLGYHVIQSFKPGEVSPEQCFEIGCEFARRFLADKFECTVSTHLDKHHLHCHIVFNSVSFLDGKMYRNDFASYYRGIRAVSDQLCQEKNLSVIETDGHGLTYDDWKRKKKGVPTLRSFVQMDADRALLMASSYEGFLHELKIMGYQVNASPNRKYTTVIAPGRTKGIRLEKLDPKYTEESIRDHYRQLHNMPKEMQEEYRHQAEEFTVYQRALQPKKIYRRCKKPLSCVKRKKYTGFMALYYRYCALLRRCNSGETSQRCYYLLRDEFLKMDRYVRQCGFIWKYHIESADDLEQCASEIEKKMQRIICERKKLYKEKEGETNQERKAVLADQIHGKTGHLKELRKEAKLCKMIQEDAAAVRQHIDKAINEQQADRDSCEVKYNEQWWRSR